MALTEAVVLRPVRDEWTYAFELEVGELAPLAAGFLLLAVAEVWRQGAVLRQDVAGLV